MHYIIYETTNIVNGKRYRGAHICDALDDKYLGSGKLLKKAIDKYGFDNFTRRILKECSTIEEMFEAEAKFVNSDWVADPMTYNLKIGGEGGWDHINREGLRWTEEKKRLHSIEMKKRRQDGKWVPKWGPDQHPKGMLGKKHSVESKRKISENNHMSLSTEEIQKRIDDWNAIATQWGKLTALSKLWGVSHTQVSRFAKKHRLV